MTAFFREAKMTMLHQEIQGEKHYSILDFSEFLVMLTLIALQIDDARFRECKEDFKLAIILPA